MDSLTSAVYGATVAGGTSEVLLSQGNDPNQSGIIALLCGLLVPIINNFINKLIEKHRKKKDALKEV